MKLQQSILSGVSAGNLASAASEKVRTDTRPEFLLPDLTAECWLDREYFARILIYLLTHSMEQSPSWEANWFAANQEIPRILWNPKVHYRTHKRPPPVPILSQLHTVPTTPSHFLKIHLNIILPSTSWSPYGLLPSGFPTKTLCTPLPSSIRACPAYLLLLDFITRTILGEEHISWSFKYITKINLFKLKVPTFSEKSL